ncbi:MAG: hypothetical protein CL912_30245 [Deltaproteobacteria bacterium]|nr:hypothetical protein [Deltaproteobacteria bacterium]
MFFPNHAALYSFLFDTLPGTTAKHLEEYQNVQRVIFALRDVFRYGPESATKSYEVLMRCLPNVKVSSEVVAMTTVHSSGLEVIPT